MLVELVPCRGSEGESIPGFLPLSGSYRQTLMFPGLGYITPIPASVCTLPLYPCFKETLRAFPVAETVKNLPAMQETQVRSLGWEDSLEEMATHSCILAWRIPRTEELGGPQSMWSQRV